jgi:hypothetical protein
MLGLAHRRTAIGQRLSCEHFFASLRLLSDAGALAIAVLLSR